MLRKLFCICLCLSLFCSCGLSNPPDDSSLSEDSSILSAFDDALSSSGNIPYEETAEAWMLEDALIIRNDDLGDGQFEMVQRVDKDRSTHQDVIDLFRQKTNKYCTSRRNPVENPEENGHWLFEGFLKSDKRKKIIVNIDQEKDDGDYSATTIQVKLVYIAENKDESSENTQSDSAFYKGDLGNFEAWIPDDATVLLLERGRDTDAIRLKSKLDMDEFFDTIINNADKAGFTQEVTEAQADEFFKVMYGDNVRAVVRTVDTEENVSATIVVIPYPENPEITLAQITLSGEDR